MKNLEQDGTSPDRLTKFISETYQGRTILVSGGRGYIGSAISQFLSGLNCRLLIMDRSHRTEWWPSGKESEVLHFKGNVSVYDSWKQVLPGVDYVFHLSAEEYFYRSDFDPLKDLQVNAISTMHMLEACRRNNYQPKIVFASSANLYGVVDSLPVNEDCRDDLLTIWAIHKKTSENYLHFYNRNFGIPSISVRLSNVYGPTARWDIMDRVVINRVIDRAIKEKTITLYSNWACIRDYVFLEDVVQAFLLAGSCCNATSRDIYLIGSGEGGTIRNVWQLIADSVGLYTNGNVEIHMDPSVEIEPLESRDFVADSKRFRKTTGWAPRIMLKEGIQSTIEFMLSRRSP